MIPAANALPARILTFLPGPDSASPPARRRSRRRVPDGARDQVRVECGTRAPAHANMPRGHGRRTGANASSAVTAMTGACCRRASAACGANSSGARSRSFRDSPSGAEAACRRLGFRLCRYRCRPGRRFIPVDTTGPRDLAGAARLSGQYPCRKPLDPTGALVAHANCFRIMPSSWEPRYGIEP